MPHEKLRIDVHSVDSSATTGRQMTKVKSSYL
jgi:hypothetical protein